MSEFWLTILGILGSVGVGGAIVAGLSSWLGKVWANRLMIKETAKFREDLERLTKQLERKNYVSKVRFDAEFAIYRELCDVTYELINHTCILFPLVDHLPQDKNKLEEVQKMYYNNALNSLTCAIKILGKNSSFIPEDIYKSFFDLYQLCRQQIVHYPRYLKYEKSGKEIPDILQQCWEVNPEIEKKYTALQNKLREYLKTLDVVDEK